MTVWDLDGVKVFHLGQGTVGVLYGIIYVVASDVTKESAQTHDLHQM